MTTITTNTYQTVFLSGTGASASLTITATGSVNPRFGPYGVISRGHGGTIANYGSISGGYGDGPKNSGGIAVVIDNPAVVINHGSITGGSAYAEWGGLYGGVGGDGISGRGITLMNYGSISGGEGKYAYDDGFRIFYRCGIAVDFTADGHGVNYGTIASDPNNVPDPGIGVYLGHGSQFTNKGLISGNAGVDQATNTQFSNAGTVDGGIGLTAGAVAKNSGAINGLANLYSGGKLINSGSVDGGVLLSNGASLNNTGHVIGGNGGNAYYYYSYNGVVGINSSYVGAGAGSTGVDLAHGATLTNAGTIIGGNGGTSAYANYAPGKGGLGVDLGAGATLQNTGTIIGGNGGVQTGVGIYAGAGGNGGAGVYLNGATLTTSGTIIGGQGGTGATPGLAGDAVQFGPQAATLIVQANASFIGAVVGNGINDTLVLASTHHGTLAGLGSQITGMSSIDVQAGGTWTLSGPSSLTTGETLLDNAVLTCAGSLTGAGVIDLAPGATLTLDGGASGVALDFTAGQREMLALAQPGNVSSAINDFAAGDTIDLLKLTLTSLSFSNGTLSLLEGGTTVATLALGAGYTSANFALHSDGHHGTDILYLPSGASPPDPPPPPDPTASGATPSPFGGAWADSPPLQRVAALLHGTEAGFYGWLPGH